jgi:hypothetical protein
MLRLTDTDTWAILEGPFNHSRDLPVLIEQLGQTYSEKILNEICWEYMYHQGSLYEATFATFPYLVDLCEKVNDKNFKLQIFLNLGGILSELDAEDTILVQTFAGSKIDKNIVVDIIISFKEYFERLNSIGISLFETIIQKDETEKRCFLGTIAAANKNFKVAKIFWAFIENEEYMCSCPKCDTEFYLENKDDDRLILYTADSFFDKKVEGFLIVPKPSVDTLPHEMILAKNNFEWLVFNINRLKIESLKSIINYLFGEAKCPKCAQDFEIFKGITANIW